MISPNSEVHLLKNVPFSIDYKNIRKFDDVNSQLSYFSTRERISFTELTYVRTTPSSIQVKMEKDSLLEYDYMMFKNTNYSNKWFYAFVTSVVYVNPNTSRLNFVIDEWQTWCFNINFLDSFVEREHCTRWNTDGSPVINTIPEGLDIGSEYIVKDHRQYNNELYWCCFVTSITGDDGIVTNLHNVNVGVPNNLSIFYLPIYFTGTNYTDITLFNGTSLNSVVDVMNKFRFCTNLVGKLVGCYLLDNPPFEYSFNLNGSTIVITSSEVQEVTIVGKKLVNDDLTAPVYDIYNLVVFQNIRKNVIPKYVDRTYTKYGNLKNNISESKLLMYPYSYVQLLDGEGNNFIIKNEYVNASDIVIRTMTSAGLNNKQAHIVRDYCKSSNVSLANCRWELQNGIINSFHNSLTIIDDYTASYLQGNSNTISQSIANTLNQSNLNNVMQSNINNTNSTNAFYGSLSNLANAGIGAVVGTSNFGLAGLNYGLGSILQSGVSGLNNIYSTERSNATASENTYAQGQLANEKATASALAKVQDTREVADNVSLQGGDVFFTYQNKYNGYCLIYKQISDEYINILTEFFRKYGYKVNRVKIPNLHTRQSYNYVRTIDCVITGNVNENSLERIKSIFNSGVTLWHTDDIGNYSLSNNEI